MTKKPAAKPKSEKQSESIRKNGGARPGAGRKHGVRNKRTAEIIAAVEQTGETPMQYMLRVMRDPQAEEKRRDTMAQAVAPYVHPKLATLTHNGEINIKGWSDEQLAVARTVLGAVTAGKSG